MALNINTIQDSLGNEFTNAYGIVETIGTDANLGVWTDSSKEAPVRFAGLNGVYEVTEGNEEQDTVAALAAVGITATIIE